MRKSVILILAVIAGLILCSYAYAQEQTPAAIAEELGNELKQEGVAEGDVDAIKNTIKNMLE